jgi:hypothetical protein
MKKQLYLYIFIDFMSSMRGQMINDLNGQKNWDLKFVIHVVFVSLLICAQLIDHLTMQCNYKYRLFAIFLH